jgi:hypothetical protein
MKGWSKIEKHGRKLPARQFLRCRFSVWRCSLDDAGTDIAVQFLIAISGHPRF